MAKCPSCRGSITNARPGEYQCSGCRAALRLNPGPEKQQRGIVYERVNLKLWDGTRKSFYLQVTKETPQWLVGWRVDKEGESSDQMEVIDKSAIVRRTPMRMNLHYGELEPIDNPKTGKGHGHIQGKSTGR